jgi:hypothetical protein
MITTTDPVPTLQTIEEALVAISDQLVRMAHNCTHPAQTAAIRRVHASLLQTLVAAGDVL